MPDAAPAPAPAAQIPPRSAASYRTSFKVSTERLGGGAIVRVEGSLDRASVLAVEDEARRQIDLHGARLVLDLSPTTFMDAAAIHLMDTLGAHAAAAGGTLIVVLTCPRAHSLLRRAPARAELCVVVSVEEAMAAWPGSGLVPAG